MRLFKKATAVAMASMMVLSMAGCGSKPAETTAAPTEAKTEAATEAASEAASEAATTAAEATGDATDVADKKVGSNTVFSEYFHYHEYGEKQHLHTFLAARSSH